VLEAYLVEYGINSRHADIVFELAEEDRRDKCDAAWEFEDFLEVVLFDEHGFMRTSDEAFAAVDAAVLVDMRFAVAHADSLGGADPHAVRAAFANGFVYL
jgi:hypothetical protein